jgi:hypothetical protein
LMPIVASMGGNCWNANFSCNCSNNSNKWFNRK